MCTEVSEFPPSQSSMSRPLVATAECGTGDHTTRPCRRKSLENGTDANLSPKQRRRSSNSISFTTFFQEMQGHELPPSARRKSSLSSLEHDFHSPSLIGASGTDRRSSLDKSETHLQQAAADKLQEEDENSTTRLDPIYAKKLTWLKSHILLAYLAKLSLPSGGKCDSSLSEEDSLDSSSETDVVDPQETELHELHRQLYKASQELEHHMLCNATHCNSGQCSPAGLPVSLHSRVFRLTNSGSNTIERTKSQTDLGTKSNSAKETSSLSRAASTATTCNLKDDPGTVSPSQSHVQYHHHYHPLMSPKVLDEVDRDLNAVVPSSF